MCDDTDASDVTTKLIPRILIVDHHDSYTLNLLISISEATQIPSDDLLSRVVVLPHNHPLLATTDAFITNLLPHFDALILGPGPGHPKNGLDFGPAKRILEAILKEEIAIPTLGVCLGHQGIAHVCGGQVIEGDSLRHGQVSEIQVAALSSGKLVWPSLFDHKDNSQISMVRYNSLTVDEKTLPEQLIVTAWSKDTNWATPPPRRNSFSPDQGQIDTVTNSVENIVENRVIMALQHRTLPLWGVQFHPESIASQDGCRVMKKFIESCMNFEKSLQANGELFATSKPSSRVSVIASSTALPRWVRNLGRPLVSACSPSRPLPSSESKKHFKVISQRLQNNTMRGSDTCSIFENVFADRIRDRGAKIWLDSSRSGDPQNRFSYMATPSWQIDYSRADSRVTARNIDRSFSSTSFYFGTEDRRPSNIDVRHGLMTPKASRSNSPESPREASRSDFWSWMSAVQESFEVSTFKDDNVEAPPFHTGFVGYFDYEMKCESLTRGKEASKQCGTRQGEMNVHQGLPSAWFGFCDRLLAYDHEGDEWWATCLIRLSDNAVEDDQVSLLMNALDRSSIKVGMSAQESKQWLASIQDKMNATLVDSLHTKETTLPPLAPCDAAAIYKDKIEAARAYVRKGESYEICVTTQFTGRLPAEYNQDGFHLYKSLRRKNPAPFSAFLDLGNGQCILSTSPERFMSIDAEGRVEMRPIKGTLARAGYKVGEEAIRRGKESSDEKSIAWCKIEDENRRAALNCDPKERAENLMIVDLIRADLLSFCPPESVKVPALMQVESYESVHQLVTTIVGQKDESVSSIEALKRCFPPGSMTGAPKIRSVDILERLEQRDRGVYSGILGWIGVDGAASTSVIIRTVVIDGHKVSVGAGGAITYLSDADKEWQEVLDKVKAIATIEQGDE